MDLICFGWFCDWLELIFFGVTSLGFLDLDLFVVWR